MTEIIIISLVVLLIIGLFFHIYFLSEKFKEIKSQSQSNIEIERAVRDQIEKSIKNQQSLQVDENNKTRESINKIQERLGVIDNAQKNLDELKKSVVSLTGDLGDVKKIFFDNKQARGSFGDKFLEDIVRDSLPSKFYKTQATLSNGKIADCLLNFGKKETVIAIDSKFPLPKKLLNNPDENEKKVLEREFNTVITKHYTDISEKYIIEGETANLALMLIPSHAVFDYIVEHPNNWIDKARKKGVQICSPTTLWVALKSYRLFAEGYIMNENSKAIIKEMRLIIDDVDRLSKRIDTISKKQMEITEEFSSVKTSSDKIKNKASKLDSFDFEQTEKIKVIK